MTPDRINKTGELLDLYRNESTTLSLLTCNFTLFFAVICYLKSKFLQRYQNITFYFYYITRTKYSIFIKIPKKSSIFTTSPEQNVLFFTMTPEHNVLFLRRHRNKTFNFYYVTRTKHSIFHQHKTFNFYYVTSTKHSIFTTTPE